MFKVEKTILFLLLLFSFNHAFAQVELCENCYVWEFTTSEGERNQTTRLLSNDVEDILSQYSKCKVLQRSRYAKLLEQINNEKSIQSLSLAPAPIKEQLNTIEAKRVIFGSVNRDFQGNVSLRLSFENLKTSEVKSNTVFLINEDYYNFDNRKRKLAEFVGAFIDPESKMAISNKNIDTPKKENFAKPAPISTFKTDKLTFELAGCQQEGQTVSCQFRVTSFNEDIDLVVYGDQYSRILDGKTGSEFYARNIRIAEKSGNASYGVTQKTIVSGFPVDMIIRFGKVNASVGVISKMEFLLGHGDGNEIKAEFRNIDVN